MPSVLSTAGLARASARHPWRVVGFWLVVILLAGYAITTGLSGALSTDLNFTNKPDSVKGSNLLEQRMHGPTPATETVIVTSDTQTIDSPAFAQSVEKISRDLTALHGVVASAPNYLQAKAAGLPAAASMVSQDRHTTIIPVTFTGTINQVKDDTTTYLDTVNAESAPGIQVLTVGDLSTSNEFTKVSNSDLQKAEVFAFPAAIVILIVVFGALVAAAVPLVLGIVAIAAALGMIVLVGQFMNLSIYAENMVSMIGLAVGIDYALFIISRYREERRRGLAKLDAITMAGGTASKAVVFSGITVVLALAGMFIIPTTIFHSLGAGAILVVVAAVAAMLTLVPAMLSLLGDRIDWPRRHRYQTEPGGIEEQWTDASIHAGFWGRASRVVMRRPVVTMLLAAVLLLAAASPFVDLNRGTNGVGSLPPSDVKTAYGILTRDFSAGLVSPINIVVDAPRNAQTQSNIDKLVAELKQDGRFAPNATVEWNSANNLAEISVPLKVAPDTAQSDSAIAALRGDLVPTAFAGTHTPVYVTGSTVFNYDFQQVVDSYTPYVFLFVLGLSFILLLLAFRSVIVPLKAILMNLLSVGTAYGLMVLVFQKGYLHSLFGFEKTPVVEVWVPIFLFCVLFGLSMDYEVFLLSRMREHFDRTQDNRESVAVGLQSTGRLITGAALIMVVVFTGFAAGSLVVFQQMGFGLAVAILIDATVIRLILVPATMTLLGKWNWYLPSWLSWLPDLRIDNESTVGAPEPAPVPALVPTATRKLVESGK